ncbi:MAG: guanylate kinase, partial [Sulfurimonas sp.]
LEKRLRNRSTDDEEVIERRIKMAKKEIQRVSEYEFLLVNDDLQAAAEKLLLIAKTSRFKIANEEINNFVQQWEDI